MCYGTMLIEFDNSFRKENERLRNRMKKLWTEQEDRYQRRHYASAFARPHWPVITAEAPDEITDLQWGLVPSWVKDDPKDFLKRAPTYNAVSETAFEKPSFRGALAKGRRCLVPVNGFYEWHHLGKLTYPHFIHLKSRKTFSLAGIYENGTYSILTCPANSLMEQVHNQKKRMPVILTAADEDLWLDPTLTTEQVKALCVPYPVDDMEAYTVGRGITSRTADPNTPQAWERVDHPELAGVPWLH